MEYCMLLLSLDVITSLKFNCRLCWNPYLKQCLAHIWYNIYRINVQTNEWTSFILLNKIFILYRWCQIYKHLYWFLLLQCQYTYLFNPSTWYGRKGTGLGNRRLGFYTPSHFIVTESGGIFSYSGFYFFHCHMRQLDKSVVFNPLKLLGIFFK